MQMMVLVIEVYMTRDEQRFSLGMVYMVSEGLAAGIGSLMGGTLLLGLQKFYTPEPVDTYRLYFGIIALS